MVSYSYIIKLLRQEGLLTVRDLLSLLSALFYGCYILTIKQLRSHLSTPKIMIWFLLNESLGYWQALGGAIVLVGIRFASR
jgi:drug/metabolite transporter (DMT)-like permease